MSIEQPRVYIPRPGHTTPIDIRTIKAPDSKLYQETFAGIFPSTVKYLSTDIGRIAYYDIPPSSTSTASSTNSNLQPPQRILLLHGVQTPGLGLLPLATHLSTLYPSSHLIIPDLWGHGLSDTPLLPHLPSLFYHLIDSLLAHLSWSSFHLIGFSFGGATAIGYTSLHSPSITSLTLIAPAGLIPLSTFTPSQQEFFKLGNSDEAGAEKFVREWLEDGPLVVPTDWKGRTARGELVAEALRDWQNQHHDGHRATVTAIVRDGGAVENREVFVTAAKTGTKIFVVLGEKDDVCSREDLKGCGIEDVVVVEGAGHGVVRDNAKEVAEHIAQFWSRLL